MDIFSEIAALTATYRAVMGIESVAARAPCSPYLSSPGLNESLDSTNGVSPIRAANLGKRGSATQPALSTDLFNVRLTRTGLDGEALSPRIGRLLTNDPEQAARDLCNAITDRGNPARIETVEIVRSYGADVFVVRA